MPAGHVKHAGCCWKGLAVPAGHGVQVEVAPREKVPGRQSEQKMAPPLEMVPGRHGSHTPAPGSSLNVPEGQMSQLLLSAAGAWPAGHSRQVEEPSGATKPGSHSVQKAEPGRLVKVPAGQSRQAEPKLPLNLPAAQAVQVVEPGAVVLVPGPHGEQKVVGELAEGMVPMGQGWQLVAPDCCVISPAGHGRQPPAPASGWYVPGRHWRQEEGPSGKKPAGHSWHDGEPGLETVKPGQSSQGPPLELNLPAAQEKHVVAAPPKELWPARHAAHPNAAQ